MPELKTKVGLACPKCGSDRSRVTDTRHYPTYIRRRRVCVNCRQSMSTREVNMDSLELHLTELGTQVVTLLETYRVRMPRAKRRTKAIVEAEKAAKVALETAAGSV